MLNEQRFCAPIDGVPVSTRSLVRRTSTDASTHSGASSSAAGIGSVDSARSAGSGRAASRWRSRDISAVPMASSVVRVSTAPAAENTPADLDPYTARDTVGAVRPRQRRSRGVSETA